MSEYFGFGPRSNGRGAGPAVPKLCPADASRVTVGARLTPVLRRGDLIGKLELCSATLLLCSAMGGCATGDTPGGGDTDSGAGGETGGGDLCDGVGVDVVECDAVDEEFALED